MHTLATYSSKSAHEIDNFPQLSVYIYRGQKLGHSLMYAYAIAACQFVMCQFHL